MTTIEQIKAEIERQIKDPQEHCYGVSSINKLRELLDFIGTLEVEKHISHEDELEEEIQSFWNRASGFQPKFATLEVKENGFATIARHFAQWGADHTPLPEDTALFNKGVTEGKRLMMEEARNHFVLSVLSENHTKKMIELYNDEVDCKAGDVVRTIIFKKED